MARTDQLAVAITTTAAVFALAEQYTKPLPGLTVVGKGRGRGLRMRREPVRHIDLITPGQPAAPPTRTSTEETEA